MSAVVVADASPLIAFQQIEVRPVVDELLRHGSWVAPRLVKQALLAAGEEGPDGGRS